MLSSRIFSGQLVVTFVIVIAFSSGLDIDDQRSAQKPLDAVRDEEIIQQVVSGEVDKSRESPLLALVDKPISVIPQTEEPPREQQHPVSGNGGEADKLPEIPPLTYEHISEKQQTKETPQEQHSTTETLSHEHEIDDHHLVSEEVDKLTESPPVTDEPTSGKPQTDTEEPPQEQHSSSTSETSLDEEPDDQDHHDEKLVVESPLLALVDEPISLKPQTEEQEHDDHHDHHLVSGEVDKFAESPLLANEPVVIPQTKEPPQEQHSSETFPHEEHNDNSDNHLVSEEVDKFTESPLLDDEPISVKPQTDTEEPPREQHSSETLPHEENDDTHDDHHHHTHHHHHHRHSHDFFKDSNDSSSFMIVIKHLSSTLLSFLPEPLQDTILDVDDALVFTGIIALTLVSICVPYFLIEGYMSVRPLKKKVVELNKSLWKVSAAYETQQEEFEIFKQKAIAHDEYKKRAEQSENDVVILKKLETKHREQITALKTQLKSQIKEAVDIRALIEKALDDKKMISEECGKYKSAYENTKEALVKAREDLTNFQTQAKSSALQLGMSSKNAEMLTSKIAMLDQEMEEIKSQLVTESEKRKVVEKEKQEVEQSKITVEKELSEIKSICHQYEGTVSGLYEEISKLESELTTIKETLGEDSPLLEVAEIQAKAAFSEKEADSLRTRLEGLSADNENLNGKLKETSSALEEARSEREQTNNRLQVLEAYFKEREEEYIKTIEKLQLKESVRDKGKEELIRIIEEKENVCKDLNERLEALKEEFEETKQQHRNDVRSLEAKGHENWLSLCQAERKAQDARKEAELLRQRLTAMSKEKDDEDGDGLNGEVPLFPVIPHELVPLPILDEPPSYFGLEDFVPPPPLPEGEEREPHRPPPLGGRLSPAFSDFDGNVLSPIGGIGRREDDCTDGSSGSDSPRRSPPLRGGWVNVQHDRAGQGRESMRRLSRATSSPIQPGANL